MATINFTSSLAGTGKRYIVAQARIKYGQLHLQVGGPEGNRDYGFAIDLPPTESMFAWMGRQEGGVRSFASDVTQYSPCHVRLDEESEIVRLQLPDGTGNRKYGFSVHIPLNSDIAELNAFIDWLRENGKEVKLCPCCGQTLPS